MVLAFIHVASLGEDQLSFGITEPPSSVMAEMMFWCTSGHSVDGSEVSGDGKEGGWESVSESESEVEEVDEVVFWEVGSVEKVGEERLES